jgi:hypothetical protein
VKDQARKYITAPVSEYDYDMSALPTGVKCILLNQGGVAVMGSVTNATRDHFIAWAPLPKRDKEQERTLRIKL